MRFKPKKKKKNFEHNAPTLSGLMLGLMVGLLPCGHTLNDVLLVNNAKAIENYKQGKGLHHNK